MCRTVGPRVPERSTSMTLPTLGQLRLNSQTSYPAAETNGLGTSERSGGTPRGSMASGQVRVEHHRIQALRVQSVLRDMQSMM